MAFQIEFGSFTRHAFDVTISVGCGGNYTNKKEIQLIDAMLL